MVSDPKMNVGKRRRLAPSEKYEIYVAVLTGQATQREAAERFGVDRSTVVHVCRTAKQGALEAVALHLHQGKARWDWPPARSRREWTPPSRPACATSSRRRWTPGGRPGGQRLSLIHISEPTRLGM